MKIFRSIIAFFQALLTFIGFGFIGGIIFLEARYPYNIIIAIGICILGFLASRSVFNMIRRRGNLTMMSGNIATPDLDELEPNSINGVKKIGPEELNIEFQENRLKFKMKTTVMIWGDKYGRELDVKHEIHSIEFNSKRQILTIKFKDHCFLVIENPGYILYADSYLKIIKAKEICWGIQIDTNRPHYYNYINLGDEIKTESNTGWKPDKEDLGIGMNALYLQG